jgi:HPt (histidine-containing phosphotransfer) domain-containing protein
MAEHNRLSDAAGALPAVAFDSAHLDHFTMQDQALALEVLGLFLGQLPASIARLSEARTAAEWRFAAHGLKGASAAVGAHELSQLAARLEDTDFPDQPQIKAQHMQQLRAAADRFRQAARQAFPALT